MWGWVYWPAREGGYSMGKNVLKRPKTPILNPIDIQFHTKMYSKGIYRLVKFFQKI